jgi:hypothetical protein
MIYLEREVTKNGEKQLKAMSMMQYEVNQVGPPLVVMDGAMAFYTLSL